MMAVQIILVPELKSLTQIRVLRQLTHEQIDLINWLQTFTTYFFLLPSNQNDINHKTQNIFFYIIY